MQVVEKKYEDIVWSFRGDPGFALTKYTTEKIDPTPCYTHDPELVQKLADEVTELTFDIPGTTIFVSHFEGDSRTNGWAQSTTDYYGGYDEEKQRYTDKLHIIFLHGKRTPIHPAVTRYLVAHEYGHIVENWLEEKWELGDRNELRETYGKVRGLKDTGFYGPGTWHKSPGELFANDFRITLAKAEVEYWPHPGIPRTPRALMNWWNRVREDPSVERWAELRDLDELA